MARCPNCNYELVLLSRRRKYKCAKCGKLFSQKKIDTLEFQKFNRFERQEDKDKILVKPLLKQKQLSLSKFMKKESLKAYRKKNQEIISIKRAEYYQKNKARLLAQQRNYRKRIGQAFNERVRLRRLMNLEDERQKRRIRFWRSEQKELAVKMLENGVYSPY